MTKMHMRKKRKTLDGPVAKRQHAEHLARGRKRRKLARETERKNALSMNLDIAHKRLDRAHEERKQYKLEAFQNSVWGKGQRKERFRERHRRIAAENTARKLAAELLRLKGGSEAMPVLPRKLSTDAQILRDDVLPKVVVWEGQTSTGTTEVFAPAFDLHTPRDEPTPITDDSSSFPGISSPVMGASWAEDGSSWGSMMDESLTPNAVARASPRCNPTITAEAGTSFTFPGRDVPTLVAECATTSSFAGRDDPTPFAEVTATSCFAGRDEPTLVAEVTTNFTFAGSDNDNADPLDDTMPTWDHIFETTESLHRQGDQIAAGIEDVRKFLLEPFPNHLRIVETPRPAGRELASQSSDSVPTVQVVQIDDQDEEMYSAQPCDNAQPKEALTFMNPDSDESLRRRRRRYLANVDNLEKTGGPEIFHNWAADKYLLRGPTSPLGA